jgi:bacterioferritin-associated ferredoxin
MYVCLCNGYRESELRDMARRGYSVAEEAYQAMGEGPCCGCCVDFAQEILDEEHAASPAIGMAAAGAMVGDSVA